MFEKNNEHRHKKTTNTPNIVFNVFKSFRLKIIIIIINVQLPVAAAFGQK